MRYCVRCGFPLDAQFHRDEFAAHPGEPARALRIFSTLFPHLARAGYDSFRHAFFLGIVVIGVLVAVGFFPLALVAAAFLVPVLFVLYFIEADLYERAPLAIIGATLAWGVLIGVLLGGAARLVSGSGPAETIIDVTAAVPGSVVLAVLGAALAGVGPLSLMRRKEFNDVLDGATFGAISGAAYASTSAIFRAVGLLGAGLHPGGDALPWLIRLATLGVAQPLLLAATTGSVCAAFWLRYRAPVRDRNVLGRLGLPTLAVIAGIALIGAVAGARDLLDLVGGLLATTAAAALALLWLRATIHVGLMEEANEARIGPPVPCGNCARLTPQHTFCGWCGVSLQALPKSAPVVTDPGPSPGQTA
jgi:hypothetical protein